MGIQSDWTGNDTMIGISIMIVVLTIFARLTFLRKISVYEMILGALVGISIFGNIIVGFSLNNHTKIKKHYLYLAQAIVNIFLFIGNVIFITFGFENDRYLAPSIFFILSIIFNITINFYIYFNDIVTLKDGSGDNVEDEDLVQQFKNVFQLQVLL